jgi:hypothetical protein
MAKTVEAWVFPSVVRFVLSHLYSVNKSGNDLIDNYTIMEKSEDTTMKRMTIYLYMLEPTYLPTSYSVSFRFMSSPSSLLKNEIGNVE